MTDQRKEIQEIELHLSNAERELGLALAKLGALRGFVRGWVGWLAEYKRLVSLLLKLRTIRERAGYASSRNSVKDAK